MDESFRLFVAIELPAEVQEALGAVRARLERQGLAVRWVDPGSAHLTLKFLGATPPDRLAAITAALAAAARLHRPFALRTERLGVFPHPRAPRVIWLGVGGALASLRALQSDVERFVAPLGYPTEQRSFSPHLTLGRSVKDAGMSDLGAIGTAVAGSPAPAPVTWQVTTIALMRSQLLRAGARYTALVQISLDTRNGAAIIPGADEPTTPAGR